MKPFSLFEIPQKDKIFIRENFVSSIVDYKRFNFSDKKFFFSLISDHFPGYDLLDSDNSNSRFLTNAVITRVPSPRGRAFQYIVALEGLGPVPILFIEEYSSGLKNSIGRVDFYGAFFHFRDLLPDRIQGLFEKLDSAYLDGDSGVRCTRIDVAIDISIPFPKDAMTYIKPSKLAKRALKGYNYFDDRWHSISFLPEKNSGYGVRMYDKILDITQKGKNFWYADLPPALTRVEFEFYPPYSQINSSQEILSLCLNKVFSYPVQPIGLSYRPTLGFNLENAFNYFTRYAKNIGVPLEFLLFELSKENQRITSLLSKNQ